MRRPTDRIPEPLPRHLETMKLQKLRDEQWVIRSLSRIATEVRMLADQVQKDDDPDFDPLHRALREAQDAIGIWGTSRRRLRAATAQGEGVRTSHGSA